jgi:protease I
MQLQGKKILFWVGPHFEDSELLYPKIRMKEAGAEVVLASEKAGEEYKGKNGYPVKSDVSWDDVDADDFDGLIIAGGQMPDKIRAEEPVKEITRRIAEAGKPIGAICHGAQILISAKVTGGRNMTCWKTVVDDLVNSGATFVDDEAVVDGNFVTSRSPEDLPAFCRALLGLFGGEREGASEAGGAGGRSRTAGDGASRRGARERERGVQRTPQRARR